MNKTNGNTTTANGALDEIKDRVTHFVDEGKEKAVDLKDRAIDLKDQALERGNSLLETATDAIKANPIKAVAIAFGVGYVGMRLFRR